MPHYDYLCPECGIVVELFHMMSDETPRACPECKFQPMQKQIGTGYLANMHMNPTWADRKEEDHRKKVKDPERARRKRIKEFGVQNVGVPPDKPNPQHIIKKGRTIAGQQKEVDKQEFIKAAAKDDVIVNKCKEALKKKQA